jgi:hypothetical protein
MLPPLTPTRPTQEAIPFYNHHGNTDNIVDNERPKPEDNDTSAQTHDDEEKGEGAPEISKQQQRRKPLTPTRLIFKLIRDLCVMALLAYVFGWVLTNLDHHRLREKEYSFRADCSVAGGIIDVRHWRVPGWGVARVDCLHNEGGEMENRSLEMDRGQVFVWRS